MFFSNSGYRRCNTILSEEAQADMIGNDDAVVDTVEELDDTLTNDVETVDAPEYDNGEIPDTSVTAESAILYEYGNGNYAIPLSTILAIQEDAAAEESKETGTEVEPAEAETTASDIVEQIADANGVDKSDITVVIQADEAALWCECALSESKCGKRKGPAKKKLNAFTSAISDLKDNGINLVKKAKNKVKGLKKKKKPAKRRRR